MRTTFILKFLLLGGMMLLLPGCIPREAPASPGVETKVVDAKTHLPVGDVLVTAWADDKPEARNSAKTDSEGFVHVEALQRTVWMPPLPYDFAFPKGHVRFEAAGYQTRELDAQYGIAGVFCRSPTSRTHALDCEPVSLEWPMQIVKIQCPVWLRLVHQPSLASRATARQADAQSQSEASEGCRAVAQRAKAARS